MSWKEDPSHRPVGTHEAIVVLAGRGLVATPDRLDDAGAVLLIDQFDEAGRMRTGGGTFASPIEPDVYVVAVVNGVREGVGSASARSGPAAVAGLAVDGGDVGGTAEGVVGDVA